MQPSCELPPEPLRSDLSRALAWLTASALRYRDSKSFVPSTWDTLPYRLLRIASEIEELEDALEAAREGGNPHAARYELADCLLFALTSLADVFPWQFGVRGSYHGGKRIDSPPAVLLKPLRKHLTQASDAWAKGLTRDTQVALELLIAAIFDLHRRLYPEHSSGAACPSFWVLVHDAQDKLELMKDRPERHGKDPRC